MYLGLRRIQLGSCLPDVSSHPLLVFVHADTSSNCYCALYTEATNNAAGSCSLPCPGNAAETCGGYINPSKLRSRQSNSALSLYANAISVIIPGGINITTEVNTYYGISTTLSALPAVTDLAHFWPPGSSVPNGDLVSAVPASQVFGYGMGGSYSDLGFGVGPGAANAYTTVLSSKCPVKPVSNFLEV
jgi:hypothetical protein